MSEGTTLQAFLAERDAPCLKCGYNLRGLQGAECPECGAAISLAKLQEIENHRRWRESRMPGDPIDTIGLIGAWLGLGLPGALLVLAFWMQEVQKLVYGRLWFLVMIAAVQFLIVVVYFAFSISMLSWSRRAKLMMALAAWGWGPMAVLSLATWVVLT